MPIVHVHFWEGVGEEQVKTMIRGITKVIVDLGVPEHAVEVIAHEIPKRTGTLVVSQLQKNSKTYHHPSSV